MLQMSTKTFTSFLILLSAMRRVSPHSSGVDISIISPQPGAEYAPYLNVDIHLSLWEGKEADMIRAAPAAHQICYSGQAPLAGVMTTRAGAFPFGGFRPCQLPLEGLAETKTCTALYCVPGGRPPIKGILVILAI